MNEGVKINGKTSNKLIVFDLDDTLVMSDAKIKVIDAKSKKIIKQLTPSEFNNYLKASSEVFSFDDFANYQILLNAQMTKHMDKLKASYKKGIHVSVITARSDEKMVRKFFNSYGIKIHKNLLFAVNDKKYDWDSDEIGAVKKEALESLILNFGYVKFLVIDDNKKILKKVKELETEYDITVNTVHV